MDNLLEIKNFNVAIEDKHIIDGINLHIKKGEIHVIMGPNGSGKSTLAQAIVGNPAYSIQSDAMLFQDEDISELAIDERARKGIFLSFQIPEEIPGLQLEEFLRTAKEQITGEKQSLLRFNTLLKQEMDMLNLPHEYAERSLNVGFSGGEKKKSEILQLAVLTPKFVILDETDSGLDIDATKIVFKGLANIKKRNPDMGILLITHYKKIVDYIKPDYVHILIDGKIRKTGGAELANIVEDEGYVALKD